MAPPPAAHDGLAVSGPAGPAIGIQPVRALRRSQAALAQQPAHKCRLSRACLASATGHHLRPVGAARKAGIPAGQVRGWGLAAMPRDRWGGIVAVTAGSSGYRHTRWRVRRGTGARHQGRNNDQLAYPADSAQPPSPDAAGAASRRARGDTRRVRLVRKPIRAPRHAQAGRCGAQSHPFRASARRGHHTTGIAGHRARAATADHGTHAARQSHPAGQRR